MPSKSKAKGSSYERQVAEFLSKTYGEKFLRNLSGSGAFTGGKNAHRKQDLPEDMARHVRGDIIVPESFALLNCECKSYSSFPFATILTQECKQLEKWLDQLVQSGDEHSVNILFFKITRVGQYVAVPKKYNWALTNYIHYNSVKHETWIVCDLETFFSSNTDTLKQISAKT